jgi:hypothetical protein
MSEPEPPERKKVRSGNGATVGRFHSRKKEAQRLVEGE